jgi:lipopolysaccharide export system protein LptC
VTGLLRSAWERLTLYLPAILMGLLALGTYWMVRSAPVFNPPEAERPVLHEPDYFMQDFSVKTFDGVGRLRNQVFGADARHYPDTDTLEIEQVRIRSFGEEGWLTTATAKRALTTGDASEVQLVGDALVVREAAVDKTGKPVPRLEFRGEYLHVFINSEQLKSDKPVALTRGNDHFTADAMDFDNLKRVMQLSGRVKGTLVPGSAK